MPAPGPEKRMAAQCSICGKRMSNAGLTGHMAWKHGRDKKRPLLPSKAPARADEQRRAAAFDAMLRRYPPPMPGLTPKAGSPAPATLTVPAPTAELIQHYESCPECRPAWEPLKAAIVAEALKGYFSAAEVKEAMRDLVRQLSTAKQS